MSLKSFECLTIPEKAFARTLSYLNKLKTEEAAEFLKFADTLPRNFEDMLIRKQKLIIFEPLARWYSQIHRN